MGHPLFDLTGRVAMVSGAARGLGRAMAIGFAEAGADPKQLLAETTARVQALTETAQRVFTGFFRQCGL